jgi:hypothetical protein
MRFLNIYILSIIWSQFLYGQNQVYNQTQTEHKLQKPFLVQLFDKGESLERRYSEFVSEGYSLQINNNALEQLYFDAPQTLNLQLPEPLNITLELYQAEVFSHDFKLMTSEGKEYDFSNEVIFYRGNIKRDPNSIVTITVLKDEILIMYSNREGNKRIQRTEDNSYIAFEEKNIRNEIEFKCGVVDEDDEIELPKETLSDELRYSTEECATVYVVCDYKSYKDNNFDIRKTYLWVAKLWNEVITIYQNEQIPVRVSSMLVYTSIDPFSQYDKADDILTPFTQIYGNSNNGRFKHLLSTRNIGGGVAYLNQVCSSMNTAVTGNIGIYINNFPLYTSGVATITHEMGHNLGSRHTHWCGWSGGAIDNCNTYWGKYTPNGSYNSSCNGGFPYPLPTEGVCQNGPSPGSQGGTIMSYCHGCDNIGRNFSLGFGTQPGNQIRTRYNWGKDNCNLGTCLTEGDRCVSAVNLPCGGSIQGTTSFAGWDAPPLCGPAISGTGVWYKFTGNGQNNIISTCSSYSFNTMIHVYRGGNCNDLICVGGNDNYCGQGSQFAFPTTNGTVYYVLVQGGGVGNFTITRTCSTGPNINDYCSGAINLSCGQTLNGNTYWATVDNNIPNCQSSISAPGVWYKFTGNGQNNIISTCPQNNTFFSRLIIYKNDCNGLVCVTRNEGFCFPGSQASFYAQNGEEYFVLVHGFNNEKGEFSIKRTCINQPLGDICTSAIQLNCGNSLMGSTINASDDWESLLCGYSSPYITPGMWYTFTGNGQNATISTCTQSSFLSRITAFNGACNDLVCIGQGNGDCNDSGDKITFPTISGETYYILVEGFYEQGTYTISRSCINPPPGDFCSTSIILPCNDTLVGSTLQASTDMLDCGFNSSPGIWYKIIGNGQSSRVSTCVQYNYNTQLHIYSGQCDNLTCLGSNYDFCGEGSQISFATEIDSSYYVLVSGSGEQGNFSLSHVCYEPVVGDDCVTALNLPSDTTIYGNTALATLDPNICNDYNPNSNGVWYTFVGDGHVSEIFVNGYNTLNSQFSILTGTCDDQECIGGGNDWNSYNSFTSFITQVGVEYYVLVYGHYSQGVYSIRRTSKISSDVCASALEILCGDTLAGTTINSTIDTNLPVCFGLSIQSPSVWYKIVGNGQVNEISLCSEFNFNTRISVYKNQDSYLEDCNATKECVVSNDNYCGEGSRVSFPTLYGATYFILVHGTNDATGNFQITRTCIVTPGDDCNIAFDLPCNSTITGSTVGALYDHGVPICNNLSSGNGGIWYTFMGNGLNNIISTCTAADFDTRLLVYEGSCDNLICVTANDNYCENKSEVNFFAESGVQYYLLIDGWNSGNPIPDGGQGNFTITRECYSPPPNEFCDGAIEISCGETINGSLLNSNEGVWYKFIGDGNNTFLNFTGTTLKSIYKDSCGQMNFHSSWGFSNSISLTTQSDTMYYIRISKNPSTQNDFTITRTCSNAIVNDLCMDAVDLPCNTYISGTTIGAASDSEKESWSIACQNSISRPGVWYKFIGNGQNMNIYTCITPGTNFFSKISVFQNDCDELTCVGDEVYYYYCDNGSLIQITTVLNKEYYILIHGFNSTTGNFWIRRECLPPAPGDNCMNAVNINCGQTLTGTSLFKPYDNPETQSCLSNDCCEKLPGTWYKFTGNGQVAKLSTCTSSGIHHTLHVYKYDCSNLVCVDWSSYCNNSPEGSEVEFLTSSGTQYYVFVESSDYTDSGPFSLSLTCTNPAIGTACSNAESLPCGQTIEGELYDAWFMEINDIPFCGFDVNSRARWYTFIGDGENTIISTCSSDIYVDDTAISIYTGDCDSLICFTANDDGCGDQSNISFTTEDNVLYYVLVYMGDDAEWGEFEITRSCSNDNCPSAIELVCDAEFFGNTALAAPSNNLPFCGGTTTSTGVWYKFTGNGHNTRLSTCEFHDFNTKINVYTGSCSNLICNESNNDFCYGGSQVYFNTIPNTPYYVFVHGNNDSEGTFIIDRTCDSDTFYCQSGAINPSLSFIANVEIANYSKESDYASYSFYNNDTIKLSRGGYSAIEITNNVNINAFYTLWIDLNMDGDFTDQNERLLNISSSDSVITDTIYLPQNIIKGVTRLRLVKNLWDWPSSPCDIFYFGEVEDYLVDIRCNLVTTTTDSGSGSLRSVANCVDEGEYVLFSPILNDQIIEITNGPINVQNNWMWKADSLSNITISAENTSRVLFIPVDKSLKLDNLNFIGGTLSNGCVLENRGNLTLINCSMESINSSNISTLLNNGILTVYGFCSIE